MTTSMETHVRENMELFGTKITLIASHDEQLRSHIGQIGEIRGVDECGALVVAFGSVELLVWEGFDDYAFL